MATATLPETALPKLSNEEISRYSRHLILPEVGMEGQQKLKAAKVLCVGTGGLGAPLVKGLAEAEGGFHHFLLLDIKPGNIQHGDDKASLQVEVVKFQGTPTKDQNDESVEH